MKNTTLFIEIIVIFVCLFSYNVYLILCLNKMVYVRKMFFIIYTYALHAIHDNVSFKGLRLP